MKTYLLGYHHVQLQILWVEQLEERVPVIRYALDVFRSTLESAEGVLDVSGYTLSRFIEVPQSYSRINVWSRSWERSILGIIKC